MIAFVVLYAQYFALFGSALGRVILGTKGRVIFVLGTFPVLSGSRSLATEAETRSLGSVDLCLQLAIVAGLAQLEAMTAQETKY